jgi:anion-transporting  ArsA/GET3 family ATPase
MMLDAELALDRMLLQSSPEAAGALRGHPLYRVMARELPGMHEYAAVSRLFELWQESAFDLIVLDTPPTTHALDFLDAPLRIERALDSPAIQWLVRPYLKAGHLSLKMLGGARAYVLRRLAQIVGTGLLEQMAEFLVLFDGVLGGVRERTKGVGALLTSPETAFILVSSPTSANAEEVVVLGEQLARRRMSASAIVMNRMHITSSGEPLPSEDLARSLAGVRAVRALPGDAQLRLLEEIARSHQAFVQLARADQRRLDMVLTRLEGSPSVAKVPLLPDDIYDLKGLLAVVRHLD